MRTVQEQEQINLACKYHPQTKEQLRELCKDNSICLGDIDTSAITDMSKLFLKSRRKNFVGIENWDTSKVELMSYMFAECRYFNADISNWNTSSLTRMDYMF